MKWFVNIQTVKDADRRYRELAKEHHPDKGGSDSIMSEINVEYGELIELLHTKAVIPTEPKTPVKKKFKVKITPETETKMKQSAGKFAESISDMIFENLHSRWFERI